MKRRRLGSSRTDDLWNKWLKQGGGACKGIRWRCPTDSDCYAIAGKQTLLRVECYDGSCLGEAVFGKKRPYARRAEHRTMEEAKEWACSVGRKGY